MTTVKQYSITTRNEAGAESTPPLVPVNVNDFQEVARHKLPKAVFEYLASGTDDEQTLHQNRWAFRHWYLRPRVLRPVGKLTCTTALFGNTVAMPIFTCPAGVQGLCDTEHGECATAKACGRMGILFALSQHSTRSIEEVAEAAPDTLKWYQSYILQDRDLTLRLIQRALRAGYKAIILTVDSVRFGFREADARNGFNALPPPHRLVNYDKPTSLLPGNLSSKGSLEDTYNGKQHMAWDQNCEMMFDQNVSWADVRWMKNHLPPTIPLILKGIMTREDSILALEAGVDGIMVSNHGGRQLDCCLGTIDALPEVVDAVAGRVPVLLDSGIRRGTDVVKALALGATAVGIGKPVFYALATGGEDAVVDLLKILKTETEAAMALCGCETVQDITRSHVGRHCKSPSHL